MCFMKNSQYTMNLIRVCMTIFQPRRAGASRAGVGLGVMLVGKGGAADEVGGASPCSSGFLQLGGVRGRGRCAGAAAAAGGGGRTGGTRGLLRRVGLFRFDSGQPMVGRVGAGLSRH